MPSMGMPSMNKLAQYGKMVSTNQYVLYAVAILALVNLVGYLMIGDYGSMVFFILAGVLSTYFTKNMVYTLLIAILMTNVVYRWMRSSGMLRRLEGFDNKDKKKNGNKKAGKQDSKVKEGMENEDEDAPKPVSEVPEDDEDDEVEDASRIDHQKTISSAYKQIEKMLGDKGIEGITSEAKTLAKEQKELLKTMESMQPMMESMMGVLDKMGGFDQLVGMASKFTGSKF